MGILSIVGSMFIELLITVISFFLQNAYYLISNSLIIYLKGKNLVLLLSFNDHFLICICTTMVNVLDRIINTSNGQVRMVTKNPVDELDRRFGVVLVTESAVSDFFECAIVCFFDI